MDLEKDEIKAEEEKFDSAEELRGEVLESRFYDLL